ncbi:MAG TPA: DUF4258 domain-containing protein [Chitinophagaceae bacterium]|nr:DUF4258 domain-containing protein [Chitinophagaceae bacterium]
MRSKAGTYVLLLVLLALALVLWRSRSNDARSDNRSASGQKVNRDHGFDRRVSYLQYTNHARCRMECREITQLEVEDIMQNGKINYRKSNVKGQPCPTYAVEGYTDDNQHVRIVFGQCDRTTKVITCIDLGKDWQCHCPGDDVKYQNQER